MEHIDHELFDVRFPIEVRQRISTACDNGRAIRVVAHAPEIVIDYRNIIGSSVLPELLQKLMIKVDGDHAVAAFGQCYSLDAMTGAQIDRCLAICCLEMMITQQAQKFVGLCIKITGHP